MKTFKISLLAVILSMYFLSPSMAKENKPKPSGGKGSESTTETAADVCSPATAQTDLDLNNVRTRILTGGDMWWDLVDAKYEVPKGSGKHSIFAGALWIGGVDAGQQLKVAAMTYRQSGNDFWPGPLDTVNVSTTSDVCLQYDRHWKVTRDQVDELRAWQEDPDNVPDYSMPIDIKEWPGNGDPALNHGHYLAPFYDMDGDGWYNPESKDFPAYAVYAMTDNSLADKLAGGMSLYGDMTLWWVFNDKGNIHSETQATAIGIEVRAQAFAFSTNNAINDMTFYKYEIINRSTYPLYETYFGQWCDADLGNYEDDYVGCDVIRGFGYTYNGDNDDDGVHGYGINPPAVGIDFFQGPLADPGDLIDNDRDGQIDEEGEQIIMSKFVYYNNDWSQTGNPEIGPHFYGYLKGIWKDGNPITWGGTGYNPGSTDYANWMFPGNTDTIDHPGQCWDEVSAGNAAADRRFIQSAGTFTLQPGAVNYITVGVVWAWFDGYGAICDNIPSSVTLLQQYDDFAQALFDQNFKLLDGPPAPEVEIVELDKQLIINLINTAKTETYVDVSKELIDTMIVDVEYRFQGYQIYQLYNETVSSTDIYDVSKARLVAQCDLKDEVGQIVNGYMDLSINQYIYQEMVDGENKGIRHSFLISDDKFASGATNLVNHKKYHYMVIPYAFTRYNIDDTLDVVTPYDSIGINVNDPRAIKQPYLASRRVYKYVGIPHITSPENNGTGLQSNYGDGPKITRIDGRGNGGMYLDLTSETITEILANGKSNNPVYQTGKGPVNIKVVDPLKVPSGNFKLYLYPDTINTSTYLWKLVKDNTDIVYSNFAITQEDEQIIPQWGLSVHIKELPKVQNAEPDGFNLLTSTITFADETKPWLTGIADFDECTDSYRGPEDWIASGICATGDYSGKDDNRYFEKILDGTWAPYQMCASLSGVELDLYSMANPAKSGTIQFMDINNLASIDIVITSDKSKWSRSCILEMCEDPNLSEGKVKKFALRAGQSVDKDGNPDGTGTGMGWFPGYAINLETGERLNIVFGEDSYWASENGRDMKWNPTTEKFTELGHTKFGGKHYIYIVGHSKITTPSPALEIPAYDECAALKALYDAANNDPDNAQVKKAMRTFMWVSLPLISDAKYKFTDPANIPCDVTIKLRIGKKYEDGMWTSETDVGENNNHPVYSFSTNDLQTLTNNSDTARSALDLINVVPNPYYCYSSYEINQLDNRVKIVNIPTKCTISIYTISGTLVRQYKVDKTGVESGDQKTSIDWDLKNMWGVPILSGVYLIHVKADIGERVIKWFGVVRPVDLDTF